MLSYPGITRVARRVNRGCEEWCWTKKSTWKPRRSFEGNQKCYKRCSCLSLLVGSPGCRWPFPMSSDIKPGILLSVFLCSLIALVLRIHSRRRRGGKGGRAAPPPTPSWQVVALVTMTGFITCSQSFDRLQEGKESWSGRHLSPSSFHLLNHFTLHLLDLLLLSFLPLTLAFLQTQDMEHQH